MKHSNLLNSLLPQFGKDRLLEDIRVTRSEIKEYTQPVYAQAAEMFRNWNFKSAKLKSLMASFARQIKQERNDNMVQTLAKVWKPVLENLDFLEDQVNRTFNEEVTALGLTYSKSTTIQLIEGTSFVSRYARRLLTFIYACETAEFPGNESFIQEDIPPAEHDYIQSNFVNFCQILGVLADASTATKRKLDSIPEIQVTSDNHNTLAATVGETKIDPFRLGLIPVWLNPIYHIRMMVAEWQVKRYKEAKEEVQVLELRLLYLKRLNEGKPDANLQEQISYRQSQVNGMKKKIAEMESKYA